MAETFDLHVSALEKIVGDKHVHVDAESLLSNSHDETEDLSYLPQAVVFPANTEEISAIMKYCFAQDIPVTTRG